MPSIVDSLSKPAYPGPDKESSLLPSSPAPGGIPAENPNPLASSPDTAAPKSYSVDGSLVSIGQEVTGEKVPLSKSQLDPYHGIRHNASIAAILVCPLLALVPPRKLDFYTFMLAGSASLAGNNLWRDYSGKGVWERIEGRTSRLTRAIDRAEGLPAPIRPDDPAKVESADAYARARLAGRSLEHPGRVGEAIKASSSMTGEVETARDAKTWPAERRAREKAALEDGEGYWGLIKSQVWEVWNWDRRYDQNGDVVTEDEPIEEEEQQKWEALKERGLRGKRGEGKS